MGWKRALGGPAGLIACLLAGTPRVHAEPSAKYEVRVGPGAGQARFAKAIVTDESAMIHIGSDTLELPAAALSDWKAEPVRIGGQTVSVVRTGAAAGQEWGLVVAARRGRPAILWSGRLAPTGDPGERTARRLMVADADGDGSTDIVVGATHERTRLCGASELPLLEAHKLDPASLEFVPTSGLALGAPTQAINAQNVPPPGLPPTPSIRLWVPTAASSVQGQVDRATQSPPWTLVDGRADTAWRAAPDDPTPFVTLRWDSSRWPLQVLGVQLTGPDEQAARPKALWLIGEQERYRVELDPDAAAVWLSLPTPLTGQCLSLVVAEQTPAAAGAAPVAISELTGYSGLEAAGGLTRLIADLKEGDAEAARLLTGAGPAAVPVLSAAWEQLDGPARRRAVHVLAAQARSADSARAMLGEIHAKAEPELREAARQALLGAGAAGASVLAEQVDKPNGDEAAVALGRAGRRELLAPLLAALVSPGGTERPALRQALSEMVLHDPGAIDALEQWTRSEPTVAAAAAVALSLSHAPAGQALAAQIVAEQLGRAERFEDRWRLIAACQSLPSQDHTDAWLQQQTTDAEEWMTRAAALEALGRRGSPGAVELALGRLRDPVPRVRAAAVRLLAARKQADARLTKHAQSDVWFLVRSAVVESLSDSKTARAVVRERMDDPNSVVRAAAIDRLTELRDSAAWPGVQKRLQREREYTAVVASGIRFARELCIKEASPILKALAERGLGPQALESGKELAIQAIEALAHLGSDDAAGMLAAFSAAPESTGLRRAAQDAAKSPAACGASQP